MIKDRLYCLASYIAEAAEEAKTPQMSLRRRLYEYQAGETDEGKTPLTSYTEGDTEPNDVFNGEAK